MLAKHFIEHLEGTKAIEKNITNHHVELPTNFGPVCKTYESRFNVLSKVGFKKIEKKRIGKETCPC